MSPTGSTSSSRTVTIRVHPEHCKTLPDPNGKGRKRIIAQVPIEEIYRSSVTYGPNPRNQNLGTKVSQKIEEGLTAKPGWFLYFNRGIVWNAKSAEYNNKTQELTVELPSDQNEGVQGESIFGNLDGGHTNRVIIKQIQEGLWKNWDSPSERQYVTLEILLGIEEGMLSELVGARNTNMAVTDLSLIVSGKYIEWLRALLQEENVDHKINWRQFDDTGDVMGEDVIATLSLLNKKLESKTRCYSGQGRIISALKADPKLMGGLKATKDVAIEFFRFVDYLHSRFETWYMEEEGIDIQKRQDENKRSGFGKLAGVSRGDHELIFLRTSINYKLWKGWLLPLAFAFNRIVDRERRNPELWRTIADHVGPKLYSILREQTKNMGYNLDKVGKSQAIWDNLEAIAWAQYAEHRLALV